MDMEKVLGFGAAILLTVVIIGYFVWDAKRTEARNKNIRAHGIAATAKVLSLKQTGSWNGNNPVVDIELEVTRAGVAPYVVTRNESIPVINAPSVQPGTVLKIKYLASAPDDFVFDEPWAD